MANLSTSNSSYEAESEGPFGPVYEFNGYLLCLIFTTVLFCRVLKSWSSVFCDKLTHWWILQPPSLLKLENIVALMRLELQQINMLDNFADYARLQRKLKKNDQELRDADTAQKSQVMKVNFVFGTITSIAILLVRVGVVVYHRHTPVAVFPVSLMYPLSAVLAFPTGIPGAIGCALWGVASTRFIDTVLYWWKSNRKLTTVVKS